MHGLLTSSPAPPPGVSCAPHAGWSGETPSHTGTAGWRPAWPSWTPAHVSPYPWPPEAPPSGTHTKIEVLVLADRGSRGSDEVGEVTRFEREEGSLRHSLLME